MIRKANRIQVAGLRRGALVALLLSTVPVLVQAADTSGLDLTIQVIGEQDPVSERAHRIPVPGIVSGGGLLSGNAGEGAARPAQAPIVDNLQQTVDGVLQNPVQGTLNTVESLTGGVLGTLGLGPKPEQ